jgi:uncharacterized integral membrane protein
MMMRLRSVVLLLVVLVIVVFAALNWSAFTTPTTLSLGFTDFQAPVGLVMLVLTTILAALFLIYIVTLQTGVLMETRRQAKELEASRSLADKAESSRYNDLRLYLEGELQKQDARQQAMVAALSASLDRIERELKNSIEENSNSLAAYLGELDDYIQNKPDRLT